MWCAWPGILPPRDGGSARTAGTSSSGRTAKTTLRAWPGSSPVTAALMRIRPSGSGGLIYMHPGLTVAPLLAAFLDPGRLRVLRPALRAGRPASTWLGGRSTRRSRSCASWLPLIARPRRDKYTTWTAVAPDLVFTVLAYITVAVFRSVTALQLSVAGGE